LPAELSRVMASVSPSISDFEDFLMQGMYYDQGRDAAVRRPTR